MPRETAGIGAWFSFRCLFPCNQPRTRTWTRLERGMQLAKGEKQRGYAHLEETLTEVIAQIYV